MAKKLIIILLIAPVLGFGQSGSQTGYYFHGGYANYPANTDLTAGGEQIYYYDDGNGYTQTSDFDVAMSYVMDNMGTMGNGYGSEYEILSFDIPQHGITALGNSDELVFPENDSSELYYIILDDTQVDLTDANQMHLYNPNGGANTNIGAPRKSFTWNGQLYWIYKTGFQGSTASRTLAFNNNDYEDRIYWFHLGWGTYPYIGDLINGTPQYLSDNTESQSSPLFEDIFADALANPDSYETILSASSISDNDLFIFPESIAQNFYWMLIPDSFNVPDLTQVASLADTRNNINDVAAEVMAMNVDGQPYKLYRLNLLSTKTDLTIQYNAQTASVEKHAKAISVYPNPTSSTIEVQQEFSVAKVYSITGQELLKSNSKTIDLSELPSSVYLLRLYDNSNKVLGTTKVVKH